MFSAIYVGLSGLNAYSRGLQQVSNNVANLNSTGFKGASVTFSDLQRAGEQGSRAWAGSGSSSGGGVSLGETRRDMRAGELRQTERDLDLAIDGSGYLMVLKDGEKFFTRTGSFEVDPNGFIVLAGTQYRLATLNAAGEAASVSIDASRTNQPKQTTAIRLSDNLSSTGTAHTIADVKVHDATGKLHVWRLQFDKDTTALDTWNLKVTDATGKVIGTQPLKFTNGILDPAARKLTFSNTDVSLAVEVDLSSVTSFSSGEVSTLRMASVDGYATGTLTGVKVNEKGVLELSYSNEQKTQLGAIAIADFQNPQALQQRSGGLFIDPGNANAELRTSDDPRSGRVVSRRLEASNVDLAKQFGELILIQRGFQASSQIISVSNDMIQQLFGIRGQG